MDRELFASISIIKESSITLRAYALEDALFVAKIHYNNFIIVQILSKSLDLPRT